MTSILARPSLAGARVQTSSFPFFSVTDSVFCSVLMVTRISLMFSMIHYVYMKALSVVSRIKDILVILLLIFLVTWLYNGTANRRYLQRVYVDVAEQYDVVAFGDSLIEGLGATQTKGFISLLSERVGVPILNMGIRRNKTYDMLNRVQDDVLKYSPRLVIMDGGSNDMIHGSPWPVIEANLRALFSIFEHEDIHVIYLASVTGVFGDPHAADSRAIAAEFPNVTYVSNIQEDIFLDPSESFDLVHPNDAGHKMIADRVEPVLRDVLDKLEIPYENKQIPVVTPIAQQ